MTDTAAAHRDHDRIPVSAAAAGDLAGNALRDARRLLVLCGDCRTLASDLRTIEVASRRLPLVIRRRDFTLDARVAARLRRSWWWRTLEAMAAPRATLTAPVAGALTALGLAGLLLTTVPAVGLGQAVDTGAFEAARAAEDVVVPHRTDGLNGPVPEGGLGGGGAMGIGAPPGPPAMPSGGVGRQETAAGPAGVARLAPDPSGPPVQAGNVGRRSSDVTLAVLSGSFLIAGLGLFGMRWTARRLGDD